MTRMSTDGGFFSSIPGEQQLASLCPEVDVEHLKRYRAEFPERYFTGFPRSTLAAHARAVSRLLSGTTFQLMFDRLPDGVVTVTVFAYDYPGEFSILTGLLSATGFNIISGDIYTSARVIGEPDDQAVREQFRRRMYARYHAMRPMRRPSSRTPRARLIIDTFTGELSRDVDEWIAELSAKMETFMDLLNRNSEEALLEAKRKMNEEVARALGENVIDSDRALHPVEVSVDTVPEKFTRMSVVGQDTPFFLYALSAALSLHDVSIEHVQIRTRGKQIEDQFEFVDIDGRPLKDQHRINQLRLSVAFTKQFTYFLDRSPDPHSALVRFERLIQDFLEFSERGQVQSLLSSPNVLQDLARLLGASDFLWEDFIRIHTEEILPLLETSGEQQLLSHEPQEVAPALQKRLESVSDNAARRRIINDFKDQQTYLIDLDHILNPDLEFFFLSSRLTAVAEAIVREAVNLVWEETTARYGRPRTVAGLDVPYAILGLGKLGGEALGYASDIELLFLYSDSGTTSGPESVSNGEFYSRLFFDAVNVIETKREGIFQVDLRLRPYGSAGPIASSLAHFLTYYRTEASSLEKLALVRMRWFAGDKELGRQIEHIRDELIYAADSIDTQELKRLRALQLKDKSQPGKLNAKFSPGALVDLEYSVQILQVILGRSNVRLRTPRIHQALEEMVAAGEINQDEARQLIQAYRFMRNLINGLRMLRGNARDLFLPEVDSLEYLHLARRTGYSGRGELSPAEQLHLEFETRTAEVRAFVEKQLGRDAIPGNPMGTIADLILSDAMETERAAAILHGGGFQNIPRSLEDFRRMAKSGVQRYLFAELALLAWDILKNIPDPDMALSNWERFVTSIVNAVEHFSSLQSQPRRLDILLNIFAGSQFLSDTLIRNPDFLEWTTSPHIVRRPRSEAALRHDLAEIRRTAPSEDHWLNGLRRFRKREILRIGTRDICLGVEISEITSELSALARVIADAVLTSVWDELDPEGIFRNRFCVMAFGKLGGAELNYSSDIDLLGVFIEGDVARKTDQAMYEEVLKRLRTGLSAHTEEGYLYRVDFRLRPFGTSGQLAHATDAIVRYYAESASLWEFQALMKLSPIAGNLEVGRAFLDRTSSHFLHPWDNTEVVRTIRELREHASERQSLLPSGINVKTGVGGIRDIEFLVQGLQMMNAAAHPDLLTGNTLAALDRLSMRLILPSSVVGELKNSYTFLRRIEHFLQIFEDRQVHSIPADEESRAALARRMKRAEHFSGDFYEELDRILTQVREYFNAYLASA